MGVNSLPKTVTRQRRDCDLNPGPSPPDSSTLTTRLPSHPGYREQRKIQYSESRLYKSQRIVTCYFALYKYTYLLTCTSEAGRLRVDVTDTARCTNM